MASQRLDEIRDTLKEQREKLWEDAIKADPELFIRLAERIGLSRSTSQQAPNSFRHTVALESPESQAPDSLSTQREELWERAIKTDPELFVLSVAKAGLGDEIRFSEDPSGNRLPPSNLNDGLSYSYAPR